MNPLPLKIIWRYDMSTYLRYLANLGVLIGQGFVLYGNVYVGIIIKVLCAFIIMTNMIKLKMWDMVVVLSAFCLLDLSRFFING